MREENGRLASITTDHLGTPTGMYDEMDAPIWKARLDLFGVCTIERGTRAQCPFRWPGQYEDEETGLYYNRFRYYDPSEGVYISQDPIRLAGGLALYGYVADPLCEFDPFGENTHIGDAGERAATRYLERSVEEGGLGMEVLGGIQNRSGHGIDLVYRDPTTGRVHVAEVKANSAVTSMAQSRGADFFGRSRLARAANWQLDANGVVARNALERWVRDNPTSRVTGLLIRTSVTIDAQGRARGTFVSATPWTNGC
jgi:RHS repeat-associated protein